NEIPRTTKVMIALKVVNGAYIKGLYTLNSNGYKGYITRSTGKTPILPYVEMYLGKHRINTNFEKNKKQTGELHISYISLDIPLEAIVKTF
ncbi:hypothetical protein ACJMK2_010277, partial [Sinanodonta woodiana]